MTKVANCVECKHYDPIDDVSGKCFGHEISGDNDANNCPANAFSPKEEQ